MFYCDVTSYFSVNKTTKLNIHLETSVEGQGPPKGTLNKLVIFLCTGYRLDLPPPTQDVTVTTRMTAFDFFRLGNSQQKTELIWPRWNPSILNTPPILR